MELIYLAYALNIKVFEIAELIKELKKTYLRNISAITCNFQQTPHLDLTSV